MPTPILIDTDMGVDDAVAIALAFAAPELDLRALVATGGNVDLDQAAQNIGRLLAALRPTRLPPIGRGLDQHTPGLSDARHVFGRDGLGEIDLPDAPDLRVLDGLDLYAQTIADAVPDLTIIAIGPLTTLAALHHRDPSLLRRVKRIIIMGGALWTRGNVNEFSEFNFYRDPPAAAAVLAAGLPVTLIPLDVTHFVSLDESNVAHLAAAGTRSGDFLARIMAYPMRHSTEAGPGRFIIHDALTVGVLLWPDLFIRTRLAVDVDTSARQAGRTRPRISRDTAGGVDVVSAVNAPDFIENMLERLCQEHFVV